METVTTRIPEKDKQILEKMQSEEGAQQSEILRRIIENGLADWRRKRALEKLEKGEVSVRRAAELAGISYVEMLDLASDKGIETGYGMEELEEDLERF